jgi:hypothetical protein
MVVDILIDPFIHFGNDFFDGLVVEGNFGGQRCQASGGDCAGHGQADTRQANWTHTFHLPRAKFVLFGASMGMTGEAE